MAEEFLTLQEIAKAAHVNLSKGAWDYLTGGADSETTLRRNRWALDSIAFRPRVLCDVSEIDASASFLGRRMRIPVALAPIGSLTVFDPEGGLAIARAAESFGTVSILSSVTQPSLEEVARHTAHTRVFQLYVRGDLAWVEDFVARAIEHRYSAFCITVDTAIYSRRERDLMKRYKPTARREAAGFSWQSGMTWELIAHLKKKFDIPLIVKGIATAEDARICLDHGVEVVYVSNHGGRQLDHGRGAIEVLPEVVEAVGGKAEIMVDGGFLRGSDIIKAVALGADHVAIGKAQGLGLAAAGQAGVERVLELIETEMKVCMGLLGVSRLDQLNRSYLHRPATPMHVPGPLSAYQLVDFTDRGY